MYVLLPTHKLAPKPKSPGTPYFPGPQSPVSNRSCRGGDGLYWGLWAHRVSFTALIIKSLVIAFCTDLRQGTSPALNTVLVLGLWRCGAYRVLCIFRWMDEWMDGGVIHVNLPVYRHVSGGAASGSPTSSAGPSWRRGEKARVFQLP